MRIAAQVPAAEEALRVGDRALALDILPPTYALPDLAERDTWLMNLRHEIRSPLIGDRSRFVRMRMREAGLPKAAEPEIWRRLIWVDNGLAAWSQVQ